VKNIPLKMKALQIESFHQDPVEAIRSLHVIEKPTPKPGPGQVLIKVEASPCNPSDILLLQGLYGKKKTLPTIPGWEGSGTVVAHGKGFKPWWLMGKRVACAIQTDIDGMWAEYCVVDAKTCIPLKDNVSFDQGATLIINPLTAVGMVDTAIQGKHKAILQTAAASQVGRMVLKLALKADIPIINIVRRKEQELLLRKLGAKFVLNSESEKFREDLKRETARLNATIAFDAVAGEMTGSILSAMPNHSKVLVYGSLSLTPCNDISPMSLIFQSKSVHGFWVTNWLANHSIFGIYRASNQVQKMMADGTFQTAIRQRASLAETSEALLAYHKQMTAGKVLVCPGKDLS
jgi:NADPH:quinone reductase-like Zn-dependent oxidoreductase